MQRNIILTLAAVFCICAGLIGAVFLSKWNKEESLWVPFVLKPEATESMKNEILEQAKASVFDDAYLLELAKETNYANKMGVSGDAEILSSMKSHIFVELGKFKDHKTNQSFPSINSGMKAKRKNREIIKIVTQELGKKVRKTFGVEEPKEDASF